MYRKGGCCQPRFAKFPTIKRIHDDSDQLEDGFLDILRPGMKLMGVNEDKDTQLSELSVRGLMELLDDATQKLTLRFEAVKVIHKMEDWATSQVMYAAHSNADSWLELGTAEDYATCNA